MKKIIACIIALITVPLIWGLLARVKGERDINDLSSSSNEFIQVKNDDDLTAQVDSDSTAMLNGFFRYNPQKDPYRSQQAKVEYYEWRSDINQKRFGAEFAPKILDDLTSQDVDVVRAALGRVRNYEVYEAVPYLIEILKEGEPSLRRDVVSLLIAFDEREGYEALIEVWRAPDASGWVLPDVFARRSKREFLSDLYAIKEAWSGDYYLSGGRVAAQALALMGEPIAYTDYVTVVPEKNISSNSVKMISRSGDVSAVPMLKKQFDLSDDFSTKLHVAKALVEFGFAEYKEYIDEVSDRVSSEVFSNWSNEYSVTDVVDSFEMSLEMNVTGITARLNDAIRKLGPTSPLIHGQLIKVLAKYKSEESLEVLLGLYGAEGVNTNRVAKALFLFDEPRANTITSEHYSRLPDPFAVEEGRRTAEAFGWRGLFERMELR